MRSVALARPHPHGGAPSDRSGEFPVPLVVDLDGTLIRADLMVESFLHLLSRKPTQAVKALLQVRHGKAGFKAALADASVVEAHNLPFNDAVLAEIRAAKAAGREVYLASAADRRHAQAVAEHLRLFDGVFASQPGRNLSGRAKAEALVDVLGEGGFDYAGNDYVDFPVWKRARKAAIVNASADLIKVATSRFPGAKVIGQRRHTQHDYAKALRVHQWLKNLLIFVPAAAAHVFSADAVITLALAFICFSLCASGVYLLNDLVDIRKDRRHPTKCCRPFAGGALPAMHGLVLSPLLLLAGIMGALVLCPPFAAVLSGYCAITLAYSLRLKHLIMLDVVTLAMLYGVRIAAGGVLLDIDLSKWLVAFALFLFFCLALVKRATELRVFTAFNKRKLKGRGYEASDLGTLEAMAAASGLLAVLVLALHIDSDEVELLYSNPSILWGACIVLTYWVGRVLILTNRGQMHDDPVVFAVTDKVSLACGLAMLAIFLASL